MGMTERKMETQRRCGRQVTSEKSHHQRGIARRPATLTQAMTIWEQNSYIGLDKIVNYKCFSYILHVQQCNLVFEHN